MAKQPDNVVIKPKDNADDATMPLKADADDKVPIKPKDNETDDKGNIVDDKTVNNDGNTTTKLKDNADDNVTTKLKDNTDDNADKTNNNADKPAIAKPKDNAVNVSSDVVTDQKDQNDQNNNNTDTVNDDDKKDDQNDDNAVNTDKKDVNNADKVDNVSSDVVTDNNTDKKDDQDVNNNIDVAVDDNAVNIDKKDVNMDDDDDNKISSEETAIFNQINNEQKEISTCIDNMVQSLSKFEDSAQQKNKEINDSFDQLIDALKQRKTDLIANLDKKVLKEKTEILNSIQTLKEYQNKLNEMNTQYQSLINTTCTTATATQRKDQILAMSSSFKSDLIDTEFFANIEFKFDMDDASQSINNIGIIKIVKPNDPQYDDEPLPLTISASNELLLAEIPVKKLYRWGTNDKDNTKDNYSWINVENRCLLLFYQNKKSYKVRLIIQAKESTKLIMNQWVSNKDLVEKEAMVWLWTAYDISVAKLLNDDKKGYSKWCAKFFDEISFERFEDQYNTGRKINIQIMENKQKLKQQKLIKQQQQQQQQQNDNNDNDNDGGYYDNEKSCYEMDVWKTYLWGRDASGKASWIPYADKSSLLFLENRSNKKIRIVLRENDTKILKLNHWIPPDVTLKSRGDQMWEWKVYDDLATKFIKNNTKKISTICCTFIDKSDTQKYKELFEKYQKKNQQIQKS